jgi:proline iminopeptidase
MSRLNVTPCEFGWLPVDGIHRLYWERYGVAGGEPWIFIHGGPAGRSHPAHTAFFDLHRHDVLLFDQRGCGRSEPYGEIDGNETTHLVDDIQAIATAAGMTRPNLLGISWGSWLSLLYRHRFPEGCGNLVLACLFVPFPALLQRQQALWVAAVASESGAPVAFRNMPDHDILRGLVHALRHGDERERQWAARVCYRIDAADQSCVTGTSPVETSPANAATLAALALELHYTSHAYFVDEHEWAAACRYPLHACRIVQGAEDEPGMDSLDVLAAQLALPATIIGEVGHQAFDPRMLREIRRFTGKA